jgi:hypothetical protein
MAKSNEKRPHSIAAEVSAYNLAFDRVKQCGQLITLEGSERAEARRASL